MVGCNKNSALHQKVRRWKKYEKMRIRCACFFGIIYEKVDKEQASQQKFEQNFSLL